MKEVLHNHGDHVDDDGGSTFRKVFVEHTGFSSKDKLQVLVGGTNRIDGFNHKKTDQSAAEKQERGMLGGREGRDAGRLVDNFVDQNGWGREGLV